MILSPVTTKSFIWISFITLSLEVFKLSCERADIGTMKRKHTNKIMFGFLVIALFSFRIVVLEIPAKIVLSQHLSFYTYTPSSPINNFLDTVPYKLADTCIGHIYYSHTLRPDTLRQNHQTSK